MEGHTHVIFADLEQLDFLATVFTLIKVTQDFGAYFALILTCLSSGNGIKTICPLLKYVKASKYALTISAVDLHKQLYVQTKTESCICEEAGAS